MTKIIAEFCQNHNGDQTILDEMIHEAAENGAYFGKIQTIFADDLSKRDEFETGKMDGNKIKVIKRPYQAEYERLKGLELSYEQQQKFVEKCKKRGLEPLTTCFTRGSVQQIKSLGMDTIKVASYDCGALPLIKDLAKNFKHLIISTGATYDHEIEKTSNFLKSEGVSFSLLHCVTIYPTPLDQIHLNRMNYLKNYSDVVGLSEHTHATNDGIKASLAAIFLGASIIERHFTVLAPNESKDGPVSINPKQLKELNDFSKLSKEDQKAYLQEKVPEFEIMLGSEKRDLSETELLNRAYYRGRFATHVNGNQIFNWEEDSII